MGPRKSRLPTDYDLELEMIRRIDGRWRRRFHYFSSVLIFAGIVAVVVLVRTDPHGIDPYFVQRSTVVIAAWGIFLLLHTLKFLMDEARNRALEKVADPEWSMADALVGQPDEEQSYPAEDETPYRSHRSR